MICIAMLAGVLNISGLAGLARFQQGPPSDPILRIETGFHSDVTRHADLDPSGRVLVTSSEDKTVRVWQMPEAKLIRVIRPPIGDGVEGQIIPIAISPDAKTVACGGITGVSWDGTYSIYMFDIDTGKMLHRITGLPHPMSLRFSNDGRLACGFTDHGVAVYDAKTAKLLWKDEWAGDWILAVDFDSSGRLVAGGKQFVMLYSKDYQRMAKVDPPAVTWVLGIKFSPDGSKVAVGDGRSPHVDVLSGKDLSPMYSPDCDGLDGTLDTVAWSADGSMLYAANQWIREWQDGGRGSPYDYGPSGECIVTDIIPRKDGILWMNRCGVLGRLVAGSSKTLWKRESGAPGNSGGSFRVSHDGTSLQFPIGWNGSQLVSFSVADRSVTAMADGDSHPDWVPPIHAVGGLAVKEFTNGWDLKLNGVQLRSDQNDDLHCYAVSPDHTQLVAGNRRDATYMFDWSGHEVWSAPHGSSELDFTPDHRYVIAASSDGIVRWYRADSGKEVLDLFVTLDRSRWVLWTPSGYYDCSPGGDDLIGWHVNRGKDREADFFPASRFRDEYYRPDVVARALATGNEADALAQADAASHRKAEQPVADLLPPIVRIVSTELNSTGSANVKVAVRDFSNHRVTKLEFFLDGRPALIKNSIDFRGDEESFYDAVIDNAQTGTISVIAYDELGHASEPATMAASESVATQESTPRAKGRLLILAIGIDNYKDVGLPRLRFSEADAQAFVEAMRKQKGKLYSDVVVRDLEGSQATRKNIEEGLSWISAQALQRDLAILYIAGHGSNDAGGAYYFLPYDFDPTNREASSVPATDIVSTVQGVKRANVLILLDTCHSGNLIAPKASSDINGVINAVSSPECGAAIISACKGNGVAYESPSWGHGAFTSALVAELSGHGDDSGEVTYEDLRDYVYRQVYHKMTDRHQEPGANSPLTIKHFPIAVVSQN